MFYYDSPCKNQHLSHMCFVWQLQALANVIGGPRMREIVGEGSYSQLLQPPVPHQPQTYYAEDAT